MHPNHKINIFFKVTVSPVGAPLGDPFHPPFTSAGEFLRDFHHRARPRGGAVPQRRRQEVLETAALPAEGLGNLLRAQREDQGQGSKGDIVFVAKTRP